MMDNNPYDDQPDWVEIGEKFIKRHTQTYNLPRTGILAMLRKATGEPERPTTLDCSLDIIQGLLEHIEGPDQSTDQLGDPSIDNSYTGQIAQLKEDIHRLKAILADESGRTVDEIEWLLDLPPTEKEDRK